MKLSSPLIPASVGAASSSHQPENATGSEKTKTPGTSQRTRSAVHVVAVVPVFNLTVVVPIVTVLTSGISDIRNRSSEKSAGYGNDFCESDH